MKKLCVFCGSSPYTDPKYHATAEELAKLMVSNGIGLVYGGSNIGTMKVIADCVLNAGGEAVGIMPQILVDKEIAHPRLTELHIVDSMHARKALMAELSDGFIALPGGIGTLEELFEILAWALLEIHKKPCGVLNAHQYYQKLIDFLNHAAAEHFIKEEHHSILIMEEDPEILLERMNGYRAPKVRKWTGKK
ncbi:MAG: TIGR00730 family Rossman fold protein [Desulfobacterales bacterium]|nr:MAG: TIGR00730 family Rossman fold protein [Desulfobacterales bacterium]